MDSIPLKSSQNKVVEKLNKTTKRILKARKNTKIAEKEAAEFEEIHKLLESTGESETTTAELESLTNEATPSDCSIIPVTLPGLKVFHDELVYLLFKESDCSLKNFINSEEKCLIFGKSESIPSEECFRKLIAYHVNENLMPEEGSCSSISLYVLYLMSVHQDPEFVNACFNFVKFHKFRLHPEEIFPLFVNFGAKQEDLFEISNESLEKKFCRQENAEEITGKGFPFFNVEMCQNGMHKMAEQIHGILISLTSVSSQRVIDRFKKECQKIFYQILTLVGRILLQYITENLLIINTNIKSLVRGLVKISLDQKIRSGALLPLYSSILTILCAKIQDHFKAEEILSWVHLSDEHLLNQLEICRNISRPIFSDLHESLVLKILSQILKAEILPARPPFTINHLKSVLRKIRNKEISPLELYSLLLLINSTLPGLTATKKDSTEINVLLAALEQKICKIEDSVDLIRLKLEIAKVGIQVTNITDNRLAALKTVMSPVKKVKCSI